MSVRKTILLVEDAPPQAYIYEEYLRREGYDVVLEESARKAMTFLDHAMPAAVVLDLQSEGMDVLDHAHRLYPNLPVIVVAVGNSVDIAVQAMRRGAADFVVKPFSSARLAVTLQNALERRDLVAEVSKLRRVTGLERFHHFVGKSPVMQSVYRIIDSVAPSRASVFIRGENGTGKDMAAQGIHEASPRRNRPFIEVNCAEIEPDDLEKILFGQNGDSVNGNDHLGAVRMAHGGTLFLDEVCDIPLNLQARLLRFVQTGEFLPIGGDRVEFADVRIIAATSRDPREEVRERRFREDLFHRLHVVPLDMPPLRDREGDEVLLANYFLTRFSAEEHKNFREFAPEVLSLFRRYDWPGNVRQLENIIRNVVVLHDGPVVTEAMLPRDLQRFATNGSLVPAANQNAPDLMLSETNVAIKPLWLLEKEAILQALDFTGQDIARAAAFLELSPAALCRKMQDWQDPGQDQAARISL